MKKDKMDGTYPEKALDRQCGYGTEEVGVLMALPRRPARLEELGRHEQQGDGQEFPRLLGSRLFF